MCTIDVVLGTAKNDSMEKINRKWNGRQDGFPQSPQKQILL